MSNKNFNEISSKEIITHIKKILEQNNISIRKLALNCEIDRTSLQRMLRGIREPRVNTLIKIIRNGLKMSLAEFFNDFDDKIILGK